MELNYPHYQIIRLTNRMNTLALINDVSILMGNLSQLLFQPPYLLIEKPQQLHFLLNNSWPIAAQLFSSVWHRICPEPFLAYNLHVPLGIHCMQFVDHCGPGPDQPAPMG